MISRQRFKYYRCKGVLYMVIQVMQIPSLTNDCIVLFTGSIGKIENKGNGF